jgi:hypothetical protein
MLNMAKEVVWPRDAGRRGLCMALCLVMLFLIAPVAPATSAEQKSFASPAEAVTGLVEAIKTNDQSALGAILGPDGGALVSSGDAVADAQSREGFLKAYNEANKVVHEGGALATLVIGKDEWPMPIPLVKSETGWQFDTKQGEDEILARRIGRNELSAIQVCLAIVDAEREYAAKDVDGDGLLEYAPKFVSAPGKRDGLYWETAAAEPPSPLGPLLAAAASEGYTSSDSNLPAPYHGYFYRILTRQGQDAPGGAYEYVVNGQMIGGFAVIAYPARYRVSGIMSFMVNQDAVVYEKDLGEDTAAVASKMMVFNPDSTWKKPQH